MGNKEDRRGGKDYGRSKIIKPTDYCLSASVSDTSVHLCIYVFMYFSRSLNLRLERFRRIW